MLFPRSREAGQHQGVAIAGQHGGMHDQVAQGLAGHAPVEPPLEHGPGLFGRQGQEEFLAVEQEAHLRPPPAPQAVARQQLDVEIDKAVPQRFGGAGVEGLEMQGQAGQLGAQPDREWR